MLLFSFESVVNNLLFLDRQRPTAFRGPSTLVSMAAANRPSLEQVKTEWGLNLCLGLTPWRPFSVPHRIGGPIWLTIGKRPILGILPAHKPKGRTGLVSVAFASQLTQQFA